MSTLSVVVPHELLDVREEAVLPAGTETMVQLQEFRLPVLVLVSVTVAGSAFTGTLLAFAGEKLAVSVGKPLTTVIVFVALLDPILETVSFT